MTASDVLSLLGFLFGILAFGVTFWFNARSAAKSDRREDAQAHHDRSRSYKSIMNDHPEVLALHGVDVDALTESGTTAAQAAYLVAYVGAIEAKVKFDKTTLDAHLGACSYCRNILHQKTTRSLWPRLRCAVGTTMCDGIDAYYQKHYGMTFEPQYRALPTGWGEPEEI